VPPGRLVRALVAFIVLGALLAPVTGCSSRRGSLAEPATSATPITKERPRSTARLRILEPTPGAIVKGDRVRVQLELTGGRVILEVKTRLEPDEGHIHLLLDGKIVSMTYGTDQEIQVARGTHILQAEYVAADHFPFNPRVLTVVTFAAE